MPSFQTLRVGCFGDSLTAGLCNHGYYAPYSKTLERAVVALVPSGSAVPVSTLRFAPDNFGRNGILSREVASKVLSVDPQSFDILVILCGTNDFGYNKEPAVVLHNYYRMARYALGLSRGFESSDDDSSEVTFEQRERMAQQRCRLLLLVTIPPHGLRWIEPPSDRGSYSSNNKSCTVREWCNSKLFQLAAALNVEVAPVAPFTTSVAVVDLATAIAAHVRSSKPNATIDGGSVRLNARARQYVQELDDIIAKDERFVDIAVALERADSVGDTRRSASALQPTSTSDDDSDAVLAVIAPQWDADGLHFTAEGYEVFGRGVVDAIASCLAHSPGEKWNAVVSPPPPAEDFM